MTTHLQVLVIGLGNDYRGDDASGMSLPAD
jgi:Ni,Fe-hydrogenase maturation factor